MRIKELEKKDNIKEEDIDIILNILDKINSNMINSKLLFYHVFVSDVVSVIETRNKMTSLDYIVSRPSIVYYPNYYTIVDEISKRKDVDKLVDYVKLQDYKTSIYRNIPRLALRNDFDIKPIEDEEKIEIIDYTVNSLEGIKLTDINEGLDNSIMKSNNKQIKYNESLNLERLSEEQLYKIFKSVKNN